MNKDTLKLLVLIILLSSCGGGGGGSSDIPQLDVNYPPTISGEISDIRVGETLSFTPTSFDSNGDSLTFSISEKPEWLTFNPATGSLNGEAPETALGENYTFTIVVSDGQSQASLGPLSFSVTSPIFFISLEHFWVQ